VRHLALSAIGRDRPGIVAAVTAALLEHGANVEDSQMTILRGHFAMMLILAVPDDADRDALAAGLDEAARSLDLEALSLRDVEDTETPAPGPSHMVTVYGVDHPGIVHDAAKALADRGIDITDLNTRLLDEEGDSLYVLMMEVALPAGAEADVRPVLRYPHPALKQVAAEVAEDDDAAEAIADLVDTMRSFPGCVGIAAPQLGDLVRVIAVDLTDHPKVPEPHGLLTLVNPVVTHQDGAEVAREGCLSIPHLTANVRRATSIVVEARGGVRVAAEGFEARCLLHEIDHLDGLLFLDRVDSLATDVFRRKRYR
jgi:peptide deformylase